MRQLLNNTDASKDGFQSVLRTLETSQNETSRDYL